LANIPYLYQKKLIMFSAVITGGTQGIGKAISLKLISEGVFVFILDNDQEAIRDFEQEISDVKMYNAVLCDVANRHKLFRTLESILVQKPALKYLVNNAAISEFKPIEDLEPEEWDHVLAVNLTSYFLTAKYLADNLRASDGAIVNICSTRAFMSEPNTEAYSASKGGVFALTHALAMSLQPHVRVNSISPGWIDVSSWQKKSRRKTPVWAEKHHLQHPAGRIGKPEDVAELCWFLLSDKSEFITGQNFMVDGGMTKKMIYEEE
jgi:NAD(P)-dependent dehydrogenase (short-subunit alcohol dehydrogenase family)